MVRNLPCSAGDIGSIPGPGTKIPHAVEQLSPCTTTGEFMCCNERLHMPHLRPNATKLKIHICFFFFKKKKAAEVLHPHVECAHND